MADEARITFPATEPPVLTSGDGDPATPYVLDPDSARQAAAASLVNALGNADVDGAEATITAEGKTVLTLTDRAVSELEHLVRRAIGPHTP